MTTITSGIGASVTSSLTVKVAAGTLAAGLATGGVATVTGDAPGATADVMSETAAAVHLEIDLPGPYLFLDGEGMIEIGDGDRLAVLSGGESNDETPGGGDADDGTTGTDTDADGTQGENGKIAVKSSGGSASDGDSEGNTNGTAEGADESSDSDNDDAVTGETTFAVGTAGSISAAFDANGDLVITGIEESAGYAAYLLAGAGDFIQVEFRSAGDATIVLLRDLNGEIMAELSGSADVDYDADVTVGVDVDDDGADVDADASADADADADADALLFAKFDA